jgi:hypothetical protein
MLQPTPAPAPDKRVDSREYVPAALAALNGNHANGYPGLITPYGKKAPLISCCVGFSGFHPDDSDPDLYPEWCNANQWNGFCVAVRLPVGVIGIDVDHGYPDKHGRIKTGLDTIAELEAKWGKLPPTYRVTARPYETGSGIRLYRVRADWVWPGDADLLDIEINDHNHRYVMVPPTIHHTGKRYRLYDPDGNVIVSGILPPPTDLARLAGSS